MKNDINIIKNELIEQISEKKQKEQERKQAKKFKEFKELCRCLINTCIFDSINKGATLEELYLKRNYIINTMLEDIKNKYIYVEDKLSFEDRQVKIREYDYPDYLIIDILSIAFDKEYTKAEQRQKKENNILKVNVERQLYDYIKDIIEEIKEDTSMYVILTNLSLEDTKNALIEEIEASDKEKDIMYTLYPKVANKIKKEYATEYEIAKKEYNKVQLPLWAKIIAFNKGTSLIGKLFK